MAKRARTTRSERPHDRLTRLCGAMTDALDAHPERGEEKCIVFLQDDKMGGMQTHGYEDDTDAVVDLLMHLKALFNSMGKDLDFMAIPDKPPWLN